MAPIRTADPFDTLGLPATFVLDAARVERAALAKLAQLHPDVSDASVLEEMEIAAARMNAARDVLLFSLSRAEALLKRLGGPAKEADKSLPPGFLMEMMEVREQVEQAVASGDSAACTTWMAWAMDQRAQMEATAAALFAKAATDAGALREVRVQLNQWRYIERMIEQLDPAYDPGQSDVGGTA
jgi:DnaJ-domain-containing protein 1